MKKAPYEATSVYCVAPHGQRGVHVGRVRRRIIRGVGLKADQPAYSFVSSTNVGDITSSRFEPHVARECAPCRDIGSFVGEHSCGRDHDVSQYGVEVVGDGETKRRGIVKGVPPRLAILIRVEQRV